MLNRIVIITLLLLFSFTTAQSQDCIDYSQYLHVIDSAPLLEGLYNHIKANDVVPHGQYFYLAMDYAGFVTAQITADEEIIILGTHPTWDMAKALSKRNNQLFIADGTAGLQIFDISDAASPQWLAHIDTPGYARDVEAVDQRTFILDSYLGLVVIDNHEVRSPRIVASLPLPGNPRSMARDGDLMFITCSDQGLAVANIADPDHPTLLHILDIPSHARDVAVQGNLLAVSDQEDLIQLYTMVTPQVFNLRGSIYQQNLYTQKLAFHNGLLLCGGYGQGLGIINVDDPDTPFIQGQQYSSLGDFSAFTMIGDRLIAANAAVDLVDFSTPQQPPLLGSAAVPGNNRNLATYGDFTYVSNNEDGLRVVDLSDLASPVIDTVDPGLVAGDIGIHGDYLYVTGVTNEVDIYSLENPASPARVSSVAGGAAEHLSFHENFMILAGYDQLYLYDLSIPDAPDLLAFHMIDGCTQADIQDRYLYLAAGRDGGIQVFDISNPDDFQQVSSFTGDYFVPLSVVADGNYLYVSNNQYRQGFMVLDISDPSNISEVTSLPLNDSKAPGAIHNDTIYWCSENGPIQLINIQDPANPQLFGAIGSQAGYDDFDIHNQQLVSLGRTYGIDVALLQCSPLSSAGTTELPLVSNMLSVFPNPFNPQTTIQWVNDKPCHLNMTVYDLAGRKVAVLADRIFQAGPCNVEWNGRTDHGTSLPSGVFLVSLKGDNIHTSRRISLVR